MTMNRSGIIDALNGALAWELRAIAMYAHYSAYVSGIHRLQLSAHFSEEVTESTTHAAAVRAAAPSAAAAAAAAPAAAPAAPARTAASD